MRAGEFATPSPAVGTDMAVLQASRLVAAQRLSGLVAVANAGRVWRIPPARQAPQVAVLLDRRVG